MSVRVGQPRGSIGVYIRSLIRGVIKSPESVLPRGVEKAANGILGLGHRSIGICI